MANKKSGIKTLAVRFNKEVAPFQHIRVEASAVITKGEDKEEVREELESYVQRVFTQIKMQMYDIETTPPSPLGNKAEEPFEKTNDNVPY